MRIAHFFRGAAVAACLAAQAFSVFSQTNKPAATSAVPSPSGTVVAAPGQYASGIRVNYVRTCEAMGPYTTEAAFNSAATGTDGYRHVKEVTQYLDGLGRPLQSVLRQATPGTSPKDIVTPVVHDAFGREPDIYLPYVSDSSNGGFKMDPFAAQKTFLQTLYPGEEVFCRHTVFESSPLNRVQKSFAAGNSWAGSAGGAREKAVQQQWLISTAADAVRIWTIANDTLTYVGNDTLTNIPSTAGYYAAGALYKNVTLDEAGSAVVEYRDKEGQLILKKVQTDTIASDYSGYSGFLCTYYVYDDPGQLRFVMQPTAVAQLAVNSWVLQPGVVNELCFRYQYDDRQRLIAKKVPGAGWVYTVYDKRDRPVLTQDANMRAGNQWLATLYDGLNRPVMTGMITWSGNRAALQSYVDANTGTGSGSAITVTGTVYTATQNDLSVSTLQTGQHHYRAANSITWDVGFDSDSTTDLVAEIYAVTTTSASESRQVTDDPLPSGSNFTALTITYYDDHRWTAKSFSTAYNSYLDAGSNLHAEAVASTASLQTRGMVTGSKVRVLEDPGDLTKGIWLETVLYCDDKGRTAQSQADNYKGGTDVVTNRYDFTGKVISSYLAHNNPAASFSQTVKTNFEYDHGGRLVEVAKTLDNSGTKKVVSHSEYDGLGQLKTKKLGQLPDASFLETLDYTSNVRGWLQGINKAYANDATGSIQNWFGMELSYDYGFDQQELTGNISGIKWRSTGDDEQRAYGFGYDRASRLLYADFNQRFGSTWDKTDGAGTPFTIDFSVRMGNGTSPQSAYDENGNILAMKQWGYKLSGAAVIDDLSYNYSPHTNKLLSVTDAANDTATKLGDFRTSVLHTLSKNSSTVDYTYDGNGNLKKDLNKDIGDASTEAIRYNHLNLPYKITVRTSSGTKGTITCIYDAAGNKLEKRVDQTNTSDPDNTTTYIGGYVYENDKLRFLLHEEGRIRPSGSVPVAYSFDYFIKDHLGNVRMVLTGEQQTDAYPVAGMENHTLDAESLYYSKLSETRTIRPPDYPADNYTNPNEYVSRLNGSGHKIGPGIVLKVMAGDHFNLRVNSWYKTWGLTPGTAASPLTDLVAALAGSIAGAGGKYSAAELSGSSTLSPGVLAFLNQRGTLEDESKPLAFVSWVLFDERFRLVEGSSGFEQVGDDLEFRTHVKNNLPVSKSGYLYIYCSNETQNIDVFFDNLQVTHVRGPLLEETHYYPFGLTMAGISSKALGFGGVDNKYKYDGIEKEDALGLEIYDAQLRELDPQTGRWWQIDPKIESMEMWSPYASNYDNPIRYSDRLGDEGQDCCKGLKDAWNWTVNKLDQLGNSAPVRWINENINPLTPAVELATGKSNASNYTEDKSRIESGVQLATFAVPAAKVEGMIVNETKNLVVGQIEKQVVSLDNNALTAAIKEGKKELVKSSIGADKPIVSITAAKEYLAFGNKAELKGFMTEIGATISKKGGSASQAAALRQTASGMGRSLVKTML